MVLSVMMNAVLALCILPVREEQKGGGIMQMCPQMRQEQCTCKCRTQQYATQPEQNRA